jgi:hypothetical protein
MNVLSPGEQHVTDPSPRPAVGPPGGGALSATVTRVSRGPGHWNVTLAAGETLRAHVPLNDEPPQVGEPALCSST